jgi:3-hydroxybutyryl-CoA dehydrogenase
MGAGIAEVLARSGPDGGRASSGTAAGWRAHKHLASSTARAVRKGKLTEDEVAELLGRITTSTELSSLADCELVIEAIPERMELKQELFSRLDGLLSDDAVLATNTSALSVTELATGTSRPSKVVGLHWFNPAPVMDLVEVVRTVVTDPSVVEDVQGLVDRVGKTGAIAGDRAGFIANALLFGYLNNALRMYESRYASREDIDAAMRFGTGHPMGPLALLDLIGSTAAYEILETMYAQSRDHRHAPAPLLKQYVTAGLLGRKSGRGIYTYAAPDSPEVVADDSTPSAPTASPRTVQRIGVIGTGTMASGIVEVCAKSGYDVVFRAAGEDKVAAVQKKIEGSLDKAVQRGKLSEEDKAATLAKITGTTTLDDLADCDLVIEAVVEDLAIKKALFSALDEVVKPARSSPPRRPRCRSSSAPRRPPAPPTSSACTGSTRPPS